MYWLTYREVRVKLRNKFLFVGIVMRSLVTALLFGSFYYDVDHDQRGVQSAQGAMFMCLINGFVTFLIPALQVRLVGLHTDARKAPEIRNKNRWCPGRFTFCSASTTAACTRCCPTDLPPLCVPQ
eukprot:291560-Prorocentrum_minimum.AAC.1